ncbi:hypothetical protein IWX64_001716 [Arthrobacter sp. CAN_A212]
MSDQYTFQNPVTSFPEISPPKQDEPEPALDRDLEPRSGRGEESYRVRMSTRVETTSAA